MEVLGREAGMGEGLGAMGGGWEARLRVCVLVCV